MRLFLSLWLLQELVTIGVCRGAAEQAKWRHHKDHPQYAPLAHGPSVEGKRLLASTAVTTIPLPPPIYPSSFTSRPSRSSTTSLSPSSSLPRSSSTTSSAPSTTRTTTTGPTSSITIRTSSMTSVRTSSSTRTSSTSISITTTGTSKSSQTPMSTSTGASTTTSTIVPGGPCSVSADQFYCMNGNTLARCVFNQWVVQACPAGLVCVGGNCVWPIFSSSASFSPSTTASSSTSSGTTSIHITSTSTTTTVFTSTSSSRTSTTTSTSTSTIRPGGSCSASADQYFCADGRRFARCVFGQWAVQSCPVGLVCVEGYCVWPSLRAPARPLPRRPRRERKGAAEAIAEVLEARRSRRTVGAA